MQTTTTNRTVAEETLLKISSGNLRKTPTKEQLKLCAPSYADKILRVLFSRSELENRIRELSKTISKDYLRLQSALVVGLLKGAFIAVADVARNLTVPNQIDFMVASSYGHGTETSGVIKLKKDLDVDPSERTINRGRLDRHGNDVGMDQEVLAYQGP